VEVLHIEIMSKFCFVCHTNLTSEHKCKKNYEVTRGGMEVFSVLSIFNCSVCTRNICYTRYIDDGGSKAYQRVTAEKPCGPNIYVTKLECIGHIEKRMTAILRRLVKENAGITLHDGKHLGGKGCLAKSEMCRLQYYYCLATNWKP
jgi:hypothetical protein